MDQATIAGTRRVSREELHEMVWQRPMIHVAKEFGISGTGLAKICDKLNVPYPPRGHWAKKEAGKPVVTLSLPPSRADILNAIDIYPTPPQPSAVSRAEQLATAAAERFSEIAMPDTLNNLHPYVQAWMAAHKKRQKEREQENKSRRHNVWWTSPSIRDLTERDRYRFRATSAIFYGIERAVGKIEKALTNGRVTFLIDGHQVECSIVEKMVRSLKQRDEQQKWTAFPEHHQSGLESSGFLRIGIITYLNGRQAQWVESQKTKIGQLLPDILGAIIAAGPTLEQMKREREETQRRYREQEALRLEARRLREIDERRWKKFQELALNWDEQRKLVAFLKEIEARLAVDGNVNVSDRPLSEWVKWAREKTADLDPLGAGTAEMFQLIAETKAWS